MESPLLPPSLGTDTRDFLGISISTADGQHVFGFSSDWSLYASESVLEDELGALRLTVALSPAAADRLIIGGLPQSRLPVIAGLIVLTAALVFVGIIQLRREYELARLRADFISGVSHELRTPLAQIRMFGETLLLGRVRSDGERQRSLAIIVQESQRLTRLIENILHFSRAEHGAVSLSLVSVRLDVLLHDILDGFAPLTRSKRASITRRIEEEVMVPVDAGALRQIMLNLLDNAVKYGPPDQTITVSAAHAHGMVTIAVDDQGPGVDAEHASQIWRPFYRVAAHAQEAGGTGIGLAIVKQLVELHQGRISVEQAEPAGARFVVTLPGATHAEQPNPWPKAVASI
ncbi:MAG: HAMP domain-containing histidine kinase [Acidobacteria bacterium]|nr:HAMP domain-containing histidine kinase [Acidobacteriota bacterium]